MHCYSFINLTQFNKYVFLIQISLSTYLHNIIYVKWEISENLFRIQNTLFIYLKTLGNSASKLVEHIGVKQCIVK